MQQCNGQRGRVWQRGPVRLVMVAGFVQLRWRQLVCLSYFRVGGDVELWLGVPGCTGRLWPIRGQATGDRRQQYEENEHA